MAVHVATNLLDILKIGTIFQSLDISTNINNNLTHMFYAFINVTTLFSAIENGS